MNFQMEDLNSSPEDLEPDFTTKESDNSDTDLEINLNEKSDDIETISGQLIISNSRASITLSQGSQYSSTTDDESSSSRRRGKVKRRQKRKRLSSSKSVDQFVNNKSSLIEDALTICDKDKLNQLAVSEGGLLRDEVMGKLKIVNVNLNIIFQLSVAGTGMAKTTWYQ